MDRAFDVYFHDEKIGIADICREGLYHKISCRCKAPNNSVYRLFAICENDTVDLGIGLSDNGSIYFDKHIPSKRFPGGIIHLRLRENTNLEDARLIPVSRTKPFSHISELRHAKWYFTSGMACVDIEVSPLL